MYIFYDKLYKWMLGGQQEWIFEPMCNDELCTLGLHLTLPSSRNKSNCVTYTVQNQGRIFILFTGGVEKF